MAHALPATGLIPVWLDSLACGAEAVTLSVFGHLFSDDDVTLTETPGRRRLP